MTPKLSPKENYLRTLRGEIPEFMPAPFMVPHMSPVRDDMLTPMSLPEPPHTAFTGLGAKFVGSEDLNWGAMPEPNYVVIDDILKWRDQLKVADVSNRDWEGYYKKQLEPIDRSKFCVSVDSGDYFLTLVSLMGFEPAMTAVAEEPEEVIALLTECSKFLMTVAKEQMRWLKPDVYILMDDDAAYKAPFFSVQTYREIFKPFHKLHCDLALENGAMINRHDCGKSEQFLEDWLEMGISAWNPFQVTNDCVGIKKKYGHRITLEGGWDGLRWNHTDIDKDELIAALEEYVDTFAPGGRFCFVASAGPFSMSPTMTPQRKIVSDFYEEKAKWYYR